MEGEWMGGIDGGGIKRGGTNGGGMDGGIDGGEMERGGTDRGEVTKMEGPGPHHCSLHRSYHILVMCPCHHILVVFATRNIAQYYQLEYLEKVQHFFLSGTF